MDKKAFPVHPGAHDRSDAECEALSGMSLRDYFAAKAMQALIAKTPPMWPDHPSFDVAPYATAKGAYDYADEMLKMRGFE